MKHIEEVFTKRFNIFKVLELIRAIYDSYYVELLSHSKLETCPEFGPFVYLWFDRFEINPEANTVVECKAEPLITSRRRAEFAIQVTSPYFQKLWDSYIFTEFLSGRYTRDEILYFLNNRRTILMGTQ